MAIETFDEIEVEPAPGYVYFMEMQDPHLPEDGHIPSYIKIGYSKDPERRRKGLQTSAPFDLEILAQFPGCREAESDIQQAGKPFAEKREWFQATDEVYEFIDNLIDAQFWIRTVCEHEPSIWDCLHYCEYVSDETWQERRAGGAVEG